MDRPDVLLLDLGGVVYLPDPVRIRRALAVVDAVADPKHLHRAHFHGIAALEHDQPVVGHHGDAASRWHPYWLSYASACGVDDRDLDAAATALSAEMGLGAAWTDEMPGAREAIRDIAASGVSIVVVSNADGTVESQLRAHGICQVGDGPGAVITAILDSAVVGVAKPDPAIFHLALEVAGVPAERALMVGDTPAADVAGALAAGVRPVLIDPYALHTDVGCERFPSLPHLAQALAS
jgi:putative hydrolase of the HAD superfamily